jgi:hypothetical protein
MPKNAFTEENRHALIKSLHEGNHLKTACELNGISYRAVYYWLKKAKEDPDSEYAFFATQLKRAEALWENETLKKLNQTENPKVLLDLLGRRHASKWSSTQRISMQVEEKIEAFMSYLIGELESEPEILSRVLEISEQYEELENN